MIKLNENNARVFDNLYRKEIDGKIVLKFKKLIYSKIFREAISSQ